MENDKAIVKYSGFVLVMIVNKSHLYMGYLGSPLIRNYV